MPYGKKNTIVLIVFESKCCTVKLYLDGQWPQYPRITLTADEIVPVQHPVITSVEKNSFPNRTILP